MSGKGTKRLAVIVCAAIAISAGIAACEQLASDGDDSELRTGSLDLAKFHVLTRSYNNSRTGADVQETVLTPGERHAVVVRQGLPARRRRSGVRAAALCFGRDHRRRAPRRGLRHDGEQHGLRVRRRLRGRSALVQELQRFGQSARPHERRCRPPYCSGGYTDFTGKIGIVGTPVIDGTTDRMYFVTRHLVGGTYSQILRAIDIKTGLDAVAPRTITATIPAPATDRPAATYRSTRASKTNVPPSR